MSTLEDVTCPKCDSDDALLYADALVNDLPATVWFCDNCQSAGEVIEDDLQVVLVLPFHTEADSR